MKNIKTIQIIFSFVIFSLVNQLFAQSKVNLGRPVNNPQTAEQNPSASGNGKYLILETDYGFEGFYPVVSNQVAHMWTRPEELAGVYSKVTNDKDWNLNYDGSVLYFSSTRYGGIGGADIWVSRKVNNTWSVPVNLAKPLNSTLNESDPCISADGKTLYFVRQSTQKTPEGKSCGSIWFSSLKGSSWSEPQKLPGTINSGCECAPTVLSDNQTLIFASSRTGGKGGFDLYKSVNLDNKWSAPVPLTFLNTNKDDYAFTMLEGGDFAIIDGLEYEKKDLFKVKVPEEFRPRLHKVIFGQVVSSESSTPVPSKIEFLNFTTLMKLSQLYTDGKSGQFQVVLNGEKNQYLCVTPFAKEYFTQLIAVDLEGTVDEKIKLIPFQKGKTNSLEMVSFDLNKQLSNISKYQLDLLAQDLQKNPSSRIEIAIHMTKVLKDSLLKDGLTEKDSLLTEKIVEVPLSDSTLEMATKETKLVKSVNYVYHNNSTQKEADLIKKYLISKGIAADRIVATGYGDTKGKTFDEGKNRLIECTIL